jgi:hypothetical protein
MAYYLAMSCISHGTIDILDLGAMIIDLPTGIKTFDDYLLTYGVAVRPRGLRALPGTQGVFIAAVHNGHTHYDFDPGTNGFPARLNEYFGAIAGVNNHDIIITPDKTVKVLATGVGSSDVPAESLLTKTDFRDKIRNARLKRREARDNDQPPAPMVNTLFADDDGNILAHTLLSTRRNRDDDRPTDRDCVIIGSTKHWHPNAADKTDDSNYGWNRPHHPIQASDTNDWWVCNSYPGEIVNVTRDEVFTVGGFTRGLEHVINPADSKPYILFTKTIRRDDETMTTGYLSLLDADPSSANYGSVVAEMSLPYRPAPYALAVLDVQ